jgi:hypothetical protein
VVVLPQVLLLARCCKLRQEWPLEKVVLLHQEEVQVWLLAEAVGEDEKCFVSGLLLLKSAFDAIVLQMQQHHNNPLEKELRLTRAAIVKVKVVVPLLLQEAEVEVVAEEKPFLRTSRTLWSSIDLAVSSQHHQLPAFEKRQSGVNVVLRLLVSTHLALQAHWQQQQEEVKAVPEQTVRTSNAHALQTASAPCGALLVCIQVHLQMYVVLSTVALVVRWMLLDMSDRWLRSDNSSRSRNRHKHKLRLLQQQKALVLLQVLAMPCLCGLLLVL